jgi:hypothetical protein
MMVILCCFLRREKFGYKGKTPYDDGNKDEGDVYFFYFENTIY